MFCKNCGKELLDGSKFCDACGVRLHNDQKAQEVQENTHETQAQPSGEEAPERKPLITGGSIIRGRVIRWVTVAILIPVIGSIATMCSNGGGIKGTPGEALMHSQYVYCEATVQEVFESSIKNAKWSYIEPANAEDLTTSVEISGKTNYGGNDVKVVARIVATPDETDADTGLIRTTFMSFNDTPQSEKIIVDFMDTILEPFIDKEAQAADERKAAIAEQKAYIDETWAERRATFEESAGEPQTQLWYIELWEQEFAEDNEFLLAEGFPLIPDFIVAPPMSEDVAIEEQVQDYMAIANDQQTTLNDPSLSVDVKRSLVEEWKNSRMFINSFLTTNNRPLLPELVIPEDAVGVAATPNTIAPRILQQPEKGSEYIGVTIGEVIAKYGEDFFIDDSYLPELGNKYLLYNSTEAVDGILYEFFFNCYNDTPADSDIITFARERSF